MSIKDMYKDIHNSFIPNSPKLETKCPSTGDWVHKL